MTLWPSYKTGSPKEKSISSNSCRAFKYIAKIIREWIETILHKVGVANLRRSHTNPNNRMEIIMFVKNRINLHTPVLGVRIKMNYNNRKNFKHFQTLSILPVDIIRRENAHGLEIKM